MKKLFLTVLGLFLFSFISNAQWDVLNQGFHLQSIDFVDSNNGWIAGNNGKLLKTTDGGNNWTTLSSDESWYISEIDFFDAHTGWAIGGKDSFAIVIQTTNGGNNWSVQKQFSGTWLSTISIADKNNLYIVAFNKIFRSSNGGVDWTDVTPETSWYINISSLYFLNPDSGIAIGNYYDGTAQSGIIFKTTDGGNTWEEKTVTEFYHISDLQFLNDSTVYFKAYADTMVFLCQTKDNFTTWTVKHKTRFGIGSYQFLDTNTGYALIPDSTLANNIMKTSDGGVTWQKLPSPNISGRLIFGQIYFNNFHSGLIIGDHGCIFKTNDGGTQWSLIKNAYPFSGSVFFDKNRGLLSGGYYSGFHEMYPAGDIFSTTDGGNTFNVLFSAADAFKSCAVIDDSVVFIAGKSIYKTTNGGRNWTIKYTTNSDPTGPVFGNDFNSINSFSFSNQSGWAVGRDWDSNAKVGIAVILNTTNTGESWKTVWQLRDTSDKMYYLTSISVNENSGWAVGAPGIILKYTKTVYFNLYTVENWVSIPSVTDLPLKKVFSLEDNVWISGGYAYEKTIFLKSTDNGDTWKKNQTIPYLINDMTFINKSLGWAVGQNSNYRGVILKSTDGGDSWDAVVNELPGALNSLFIKDNYAWAVGQNGLLLRTTNSGLTWIDDDNNFYPIEFKLEQNYPNPFNPNTIITWQMPVAGRVKIKIYNSLGKEVETLINEELPAGLHKVEFNGSRLSSGVYFYTMETGTFSESRKMLLLK